MLNKVRRLTDKQVAALLEFIESMQSDKLPESYKESEDPLLNDSLLFSGTPDFAERSEEVLQAELGVA